MPAIMHNSSLYIGLAVEAANRFGASGTTNNREAITSVVFAASALEAFINERIEWAVQLCAEGEQPEVVRTFASVLTDAENSRASLESKYKLARWILAGKAYEEGANPYQDFSLLISLRNSLLHLKPATTVLKRLNAKGVLLPEEEAFESSFGGSLAKPMAGAWTERVATKPMAVWACKAATNLVVDFLDSLDKEKVGNKFALLNSHLVRNHWADIWSGPPFLHAMGIDE